MVYIFHKLLSELLLTTTFLNEYKFDYPYRRLHLQKNVVDE